MTTNHRVRLLSAASIAAAFALSLAAAAQETPAAPAAPADVTEEIIVTSTHREENIQDVPFAVSAQTEDQLRAAGSRTLEDIALSVPSLSVQNLGPGQSQVAMRGISAGQIVRDQPGVKEQVGIYLDESVISLSLFTPDLDLFDLSRVEVLRGPQGTLFGSGSVSGTVRYITNQPDLEEVDAALEAGINFVQDGGRGGDLKGMINMPIVEGKLGLRFAGYWTAYPGFIDALTPTGKDHDVNEGTRWGFRASLLWEPTDSIRITPRVIYQDLSVDGFNRVDRFNILANEFNTNPATLTADLGKRQQFRQLEESFTDKFLLVDLNAAWDLTDALTLSSISSYSDRDILQIRDATQLTGSVTGQAGVFTATGFPPAVYTLDAPLDDATDVEVFTQELRMAGSHEIAAGFNWVAGFFYSNIDRDYGQSLFVDGFEVQSALAGAPFQTEGPRAGTDILFFSDIAYDFKQWALFGEATLALNAEWELTGGLRYYDFKEDRVLDFDGLFAVPTFGAGARVTSDGFNPRVILAYSPTEDLTLSLQGSRGFRLGGVNDPLNGPICNASDLSTFSGHPTFKDEAIWNGEVDAKLALLDGRVSVNGAVFYSHIKDLQANFDAASCSSRVILNVPKARSVGVEMEIAARPTENLDFAVSANFTDSELQSTLFVAGSNAVLQGAEKGNRLPTTPKFQLSAAATYTQPALINEFDGFVSLSYQHIGSRWTRIGDEDPTFLNPIPLITSVGNPTIATLVLDPKMSAYDLLNTRIGVRNEKWELAFYINNLTDERAELGLDRERGGRARVGFLTNQPRTFGFTTRIAY